MIKKHQNNVGAANSLEELYAKEEESETTHMREIKHVGPFYKNREDTLAEVGITQRQLSYWRKEGLFKPSRGDRARSYTAEDIEHLQYLKRLIVVFGMPVEIVRQLLQNAAKRRSSVDAPAEYHFLNLATGQLVSPADAVATLFTELGGAHAASAALSEWALKLALAWFKEMQVEYLRMPRVYAAMREEFIDAIKWMDQIARVDYASGPTETEDAQLGQFPPLTDDPEYTQDQLSDMFRQQKDQWASVLSSQVSRLTGRSRW